MDILLDGGSFLQQRDYTLIIDKSAQMGTIDSSTGKTYWSAVQQPVLAMATKCEELDSDGITLYMFADEFQRYDNVTADRAARIFSQHQPQGEANLATVLRDATNNYFYRRSIGMAKPNGETFVVLTAGQPTSPEAVERVTIDISHKLDRDGELGISLVQVNSNLLVTRFLQHLDDDLVKAGAKYDICSTVALDRLQEVTLTRVLLDAVAS